MKRWGFFLLSIVVNFNISGSKIYEKPKAIRFVPEIELIGNETAIEKCPRCDSPISCFSPGHFYCSKCSDKITIELKETFRKRFIANLKREQNPIMFIIKGYDYYQKEFFLKHWQELRFFLSGKPSMYSKCPHIIYLFELIYNCSFDKNNKIEYKNVLTFWGNTLTVALNNGFPAEKKKIKKVFKKVKSYALMISSKN